MPEVITNGGALVKVILSNDFEKIYEAEYDYIDYIQNCYYEEPNHCKIFTFRDIYRFNDDLNKLVNGCKNDVMSTAMVEVLKVKIADICNKFVNGGYLTKSINYYNIWDNERK